MKNLRSTRTRSRRVARVSRAKERLEQRLDPLADGLHRGHGDGRGGRGEEAPRPGAAQQPAPPVRADNRPQAVQEAAVPRDQQPCSRFCSVAKHLLLTSVPLNPATHLEAGERSAPGL